MHALGNLIRQRQAVDPSLTYERIAELSGGAFTYGAVATWAKSIDRLDALPRPKNIIGLAQALGVPPLTVLLAAAEAAGINVSEPERRRLAERIPADADRISPEDQKIVLQLIDSFIEKEKLRGKTEK